MSSITHTKVSGIADGADTTLIRPTDWNAVHVISLTTAEAALGGNVAMGSPNTYFDGPSLILNGSYFLIAHLSFSVTALQTITIKLWNSVTVSASGELTFALTTYTGTITVAGYITTSGSETWKVSAASTAATATMRAAALNNGAGNNASKIIALKVT